MQPDLEHTSILQQLKQNHLFHSLSDDELQTILSITERQQVGQGRFFIHEGNSDKSVYVIEEGSVEIVIHAGDQESPVVLTTLGKGAVVGEMSLLQGDQRRTASARTKEDSVLLRIDFQHIRFYEEYGSLYTKILGNLAKELSRKLVNTNTITLESMKKELESSRARIAMGLFTVNILFLLSIYTLALRSLAELVQAQENSTSISVGILAFMALFMFVLIKRFGYPLRTFGLTLDNWKRVLLQAVMFSLPVMGLIVLLKWLAITMIPGFASEPLFNPAAIFRGQSEFDLSIYVSGLVAYAIFCPIQEFVCRGGIQSALDNFLPETKHKTLLTIVLSNLLFAMAHSHLTLSFALFTFVPGLFWGWMFSKQKSLVGVSVSHILIGVWTVFVLGIETMLTK